MAELQTRMSYSEWLDWLAYFELQRQPEPDELDDVAPPGGGNPLLAKFRQLLGETP